MTFFLKSLSLIILFTYINCDKQKYMDNSNLELTIKKFVAEKAEKELGFNKDFYEHYKVSKMHLDEAFIKYDIFYVYFTLSSPKQEFYISYAYDQKKLFDLRDYKKNRAVGFSKIIDFKKIINENDVIKVTSIYLQMSNEISLNKISDIPGASLIDKDSYIIEPPQIKQTDYGWFVELFTWAELGGRLLKHRILIDKKSGITDEIKIVAKYIGKWQAPM